MKKRLFRMSIVWLIVLVGALACSSPQAKSTPLDQKSLMKAKLDQLVTVKDIARFSEPLGIIRWQMDEEFVGEYRVYRVFRGHSWSVSRNLAANCIWQMSPGMTFQETVDWLISAETIPASAKAVPSAYEYEDDFGLYAWLGSNGHSVYDAFLLKDGFLYGAEVDIGTPGGLSPETLFASKYGQPVDGFLHDVLTANLARND